jgi:hypothetical protein
MMPFLQDCLHEGLPSGIYVGFYGEISFARLCSSEIVVFFGKIKIFLQVRS